MTVDWMSFWVSVQLAACTTGILLILGVPLAFWLASMRCRGKFLIEAVVALPLVLPPTVLGFYVLMATGPNSPVGEAFVALTGLRLPFTFLGILLGSVLFNLPLAVRPFVSTFSAMDTALA